MSVPFEGGCRCRAIRYRCISEPLFVLHCHCRDCQYASGGACSTGIVVNRDSITIHGQVISFTSQADSGRTVFRQFCGTCGSPLFAGNEAFPALLTIKAASLDDPSWLRPTAHIWTQSAQPWANIHDDLTKFTKNFGSS